MTKKNIIVYLYYQQLVDVDVGVVRLVHVVQILGVTARVLLHPHHRRGHLGEESGLRILNFFYAF